MVQLNGCECKAGSWSAILDRMPPEKPRLTVIGVCTCPTAGFKAELRKALVQGVNPKSLLLELATTPPSNATNEVVTDYDVRYYEADSPQYTDVKILPCMITIPVEEVS